MIEREVILDQFHNWRGELLRACSKFALRARLRRSSALHPYFQRITPLLNVNGQLSNRSEKSAADLSPMKDLTGIECHRQIKIWRENLNQFHSCHRLTRQK